MSYFWKHEIRDLHIFGSLCRSSWVRLVAGPLVSHSADGRYWAWNKTGSSAFVDEKMFGTMSTNNNQSYPLTLLKPSESRSYALWLATDLNSELKVWPFVLLTTTVVGERGSVFQSVY